MLLPLTVTLSTCDHIRCSRGSRGFLCSASWTPPWHHDLHPLVQSRANVLRTFYAERLQLFEVVAVKSPCLTPITGAGGLLLVYFSTLSIGSTLNTGSTFLCVQVCSGWSRVSWRLPHDSSLDGLVLDNQGSTSILQLYNATWRHSGKYVCEEVSSDQSREIDIFVQGIGDPSVTNYLQEH